MLTVTQAAERLSLTPDRVRQLIVAGALKAERIGKPPRGLYVIDEADLEAFAKLDRPRGKRRVKE